MLHRVALTRTATFGFWTTIFRISRAVPVSAARGKEPLGRGGYKITGHGSVCKEHIDTELRLAPWRFTLRLGLKKLEYRTRCNFRYHSNCQDADRNMKEPYTPNQMFSLTVSPLH